MAGNTLFVSGSTPAAPHLATEVAGLAAGQRPLAVILGCSDSRAAAEILFQARMGDLFVVRVAGNTADALGLGSIDYAVHYLKCPLVVVLGHSSCGAVSAAVDMVVKHARFEPPVLDVLEPILPAILEAQASNPEDLVDASVRTHVLRVANRLKAAPSLKPLLDEGRLKIVAAHYDLANGKVGLVT
jgi:carbonic anhydrase